MDKKEFEKIRLKARPFPPCRPPGLKGIGQHVVPGKEYDTQFLYFTDSEGNYWYRSRKTFFE